MTVLDSLFVGIFGICVVFIVLVGLSLVLRFQSALIVWLPKAKTALAVRFSKAKAGRTLVRETADTDAVPTVPEPPAIYGEPDDASEIIISPVPGTVLEVMVTVGADVRRGTPLMLLEAMKMEYEVNASTDGTVTQIFTSVGAAVEAGTPLIEIR
ncbi:MAG: acetyl-CoA carboxylase biotin carboxyl carrier protein subunit [Clostridiales bacterium]|nr:acetyl-CoA carboxylase biotin carboxyl carrier protein subunit [Clostridiales bacterium]